MKGKILLLIFFLLSASIAWAGASAKLKQHGADLMKAPFVIRYKFGQVFHKDWLKSTYDERKYFLTNWYAIEKIDRKKAKEEKKQEVQKSKEIRMVKKAQKKRIKDIVKADEKVKKEERKIVRKSKRDLNKKVSNQQKELKNLH